MPPNDLHVAQEGSRRAEVRAVPRTTLSVGDSFEEIIALDQPVILEGLDIGPCTTKWSLDYITRQIGEERKVREHNEKQDHTQLFETTSKSADHKWA